MTTIVYQGNEWDLNYFITATEFMESNLGEEPSNERIKRVQDRYQAIEDLMSPSKAEEPRKKRGRKKAVKEESVPDTPEG